MSSKKQYKCPCCGAPMPKLGIDRSKPYLGSNQQALFNLIKTCPNGITSEAIRERLLTTNRDGDAYSHHIVPTMAAQINKKIKAWGLQIKATGGPGSVYRLIQL